VSIETKIPICPLFELGNPAQSRSRVGSEYFFELKETHSRSGRRLLRKKTLLNLFFTSFLEILPTTGSAKTGKRPLTFITDQLSSFILPRVLVFIEIHYKRFIFQGSLPFYRQFFGHFLV
jgi:hypothetical protein